MEIAAWWANTRRHNEAWEQAKAELGAGSDVRAIARHAQEILNRAKMTPEPETEYMRRRP